MKGIVFKHSSVVSGIENHLREAYQLIEVLSLQLGKPELTIKKTEIGKFKLTRSSV